MGALSRISDKYVKAECDKQEKSEKMENHQHPVNINAYGRANTIVDSTEIK
jgi:hypothetical protein